MKTLVIFTEVPDEQPKIAFLDGDLRHLNGVYINDEESEEKQNEVYKLFYDVETDKRKDELFVQLPASYQFLKVEFDFIIQCGFYL